jgi:hypothetical protein
MTLATLTRHASGLLVVHSAAAGEWIIAALSDLRGMWRAERQRESDTLIAHSAIILFPETGFSLFALHLLSRVTSV